MAELDAELAAEVEEIDRRWAAVAEQVDQIEVGLEKSDIHLDQMVLVWIPTQRVAKAHMRSRMVTMPSSSPSP